MHNDALIFDCLKRGLPQAPQAPLACSRRSFILGAAASLLCHDARSEEAALPQIDPDFWKRPRELWLKRLETGEQARVCYWTNGKYLPEGYSQLCWLMRDLRERQAVQMDTMLLNVLAGIHAYYRAYGVRQPLILTSGFRTFETNRRLAGEGAARNSMHLYGKAADITLPGISVEHLGRVKQYLHAGGLGFYPTKHFIHVDTGRARIWRG